MFAGVGERTREGNDLYREMIESGVIKLGDKQVDNEFHVSHPHLVVTAFLSSFLDMFIIYFCFLLF